MMAKVVKTYKNETITTILTFRGKDFTLTMPPWENGKRTSKEKSLADQVGAAYPEEEDIDKITDIVDNLEFGNDDDIEESLRELHGFE